MLSIRRRTLESLQGEPESAGLLPGRPAAALFLDGKRPSAAVSEGLRKHRTAAPATLRPSPYTPSLLIREGVHPNRISERLGHSSIKLTMDTYGHLFDGADQESAEKMEKLFGQDRRVLPFAPRKAS